MQSWRSLCPLFSPYVSRWWGIVQFGERWVPNAFHAYIIASIYKELPHSQYCYTYSVTSWHCSTYKWGKGRVWLCWILCNKTELKDSHCWLHNLHFCCYCFKPSRNRHIYVADMWGKWINMFPTTISCKSKRIDSDVYERYGSCAITDSSYYHCRRVARSDSVGGTN